LIISAAFSAIMMTGAISEVFPVSGEDNPAQVSQEAIVAE
jgi:hypothetical protein